MFPFAVFQRQRQRPSHISNTFLLITFLAPAKAHILGFRLDLDIPTAAEPHHLIDIVAIQLRALSSLLRALPRLRLLLLLSSLFVVSVLDTLCGTLLGRGLSAASFDCERGRVALADTGGQSFELGLDFAEGEARGAGGVLRWSG